MRQLGWLVPKREKGEKLETYLEFLLSLLAQRLEVANSDPRGLQLDHYPALILREFSWRTRKYTPEANDPLHLIYRTKPNHDEKTFGRKPGAERTVTTKGSDIWLKKKFKRLEGKRKRKRRIASRQFKSLKQRGLRSLGKRGFS
jgi:hypothetical protein